MGRLYQTDDGAGGGVTRFLYDGDALVAEYDSTGALLRRYVHGVGMDTPLIWYEGSATGDTTRRQLFANWQGSITTVMKGDESGQAIAINAYGPYGIPNDTNNGRFQYTGQIYLPEIGIYYYKNRVYSPYAGRFLQTDPIGYEDQFNLYAYVGNDPINQIDPNGEFALSLGFDIQGSIAGFGGGVSGKVAVSLSRGENGKLKFQFGGTAGVQTGAASAGLRFNENMSLGEKAAAVGAAILDTGTSAAAEVGAYVGTDANPADVEDLGGTSVEIGGSVGKKSLARAIGGPVGSAVKAAPGTTITGEVVSGENGIKGVQVGAGAGAGFTMDVDISSEPAILIEEEF